MFDDLYKYIKDYDIDNASIIMHNDDDTKTKLLKILKKRIYDAKQAYVVLLDNNLSSDAILIAGHILETAAMILYVNDSDKTYHTQKYIAQSCIQYLYALFKNIPFAERQDLKTSIDCTISSLQDSGALIIGDKITRNKSDKKLLNIFVLNILSNINVSYETKVKIIETFYDLPTVSDYIRYFCKQMEDRYDTKTLPKIKQPLFIITAFYDKYCEIKHASIYCCSCEEIEQDKIKATNYGPEQSIPVVAYCLDMIKEI